MTELNEPGAGGRRPRRRAMRQSGPPTEGTTEVVERTTAPAVERAAQRGDAGPTAAENASAAVPVDAPVAESSVSADSTVELAEPVPVDAAPEDSAEIADSAAEEQSERVPGKLGWLGWIAAAVAAVSALVLIGSGGFLIYHEQHVDALARQRADYIQTAKQVVLNLTNISGDTAPKDIDRVLSVASGQLKQEYSERKDAYAQVVQQAKVKASGQIIETALESEDDHTARVLVAAAQTLTNAGSPDPQQRYYRFRVTVTRDDSGHLTGSQVEFVA
ncbi:hypothetical protein [Nocardia miyunensis]|uniref:hypothetical protein n=1 Tax=Nocardia miyunensis TaxID=282684 RepID=UPI000832B027|nr:hypothetical protein [Nocardia miyunensis]